LRTSGRRIRKDERARATCDFCGARFDLRDLTRDASGLLRCPQEGDGRDAVTLNEANVAAAEAWADRKMPEPYDPGQYDKETAVALGQRTGNILQEDGTPITGEDGVYLLQG
jgi:hypothetical protein